MRSSVKILLLLIGLRCKDKGITYTKEIKTSPVPTVSPSPSVFLLKLRWKVGKTVFKDMSPSSVMRTEMHQWTHLCRPPPPTVYGGRWTDGKGLFTRTARGKRRTLVSYALLLTLNQDLGESMDALKTKFQRKSFSAAPRKGLVRLWTVKKKKNQPCCKVITNWF